MNFQYSCVLLLALFAASQAYSANWGRRNNSDYLLYRQTEVRAPLKNNYWNLRVDFPRAGTNNPYTIHGIFVTDNFHNKSGASPTLYSGGPNYRFATINLKSAVGKGINSTIEIWGR